MEKIKREFLTESLHEESNMFVLVVIAHGNDRDDLLDRDEEPAWNTDSLASELSAVRSLRGRPKVLIVQACRGGESGCRGGESGCRGGESGCQGG